MHINGFTTVYEYESYLHCVTIRKFRRLLAQFRVSAYSLEIERGRYSGVARTDRICKICQSSIEDEYLLVFICDIYKDLRVKYLSKEYIISHLTSYLVTVKNKYRLNLLYSCIMPWRGA